MYPELLGPLLTLAVLLVGGVLAVALRQPVSRRLALRQLARRRSEAVLAIVGSTLGTAIIVGSLVVGDTLNFSVRQDAYRTLGPIDERVLTTNAATGAAVARRLQGLTGTGDVDGVLSGLVGESAAVVMRGGESAAEPRVLAWDLDLPAAARFGAAGGPSGLGGPNPRPGEVVVNRPLADSLHVGRGDTVTFYLYGTTYRLVVARIVAERGVAGAGFGQASSRNAWLAPGVLETAAEAAGASPRGVTFVSNTGGVERGAALTDRVSREIRDALGTSAAVALVETPKRDVLDAAEQTGDMLGSLFLMIGSFSIIAGALLLVNIFTMLAEERKSQLGMLRAVGMKRSRLVGSFAIEGSSYAVVSLVPGVLLGLGVGWAVALIAAQIFRSFSASGEGLAISFAVTPTSIVNAAAMGLVIGIGTILATSVRISRFNVIAAIRDLPPSPTERSRRLTLVVSSLFAVLFGLAAIPAVASSRAEASYLLPSLAAFCAIPALRRVVGARRAVTGVAAGILTWCLLAPVLRPHLFDESSMAVYVVQGTIVAFSAVALVSQNQDVVLAPLRRLVKQASEAGLALHLAVAYPLAKRFRTGATLVMYTLITLVLVLLVEIAGIINASVDQQVADATAGYSLRTDLNPQQAGSTIADLRTGAFDQQLAEITPLLQAPALATDPGRRTDEEFRATAVGIPTSTMSSMSFSARLDGLGTDAAVWERIDLDPRYVAMDQFFASSGGPVGTPYAPGDTFTLVDPRTGVRQEKIIAGILSNALIFYSGGSEAQNAYPIVASGSAVRDQFGADAQVSAALLKTRPGVDPQLLGPRLQARYLSASLVATPIEASVRRMFSANMALFRLMQGFLALGLVIGITGLGVMMVRAVRERQRTIGVLRALGFRARTVQRSFLLESGLIALQGVVLGSVLGVLTTWLMFQKSATFEGVRVAFPIEWVTILLLALATMLASLAVTLPPARRAAHILPALAVRVAD